MFRLLRLSVAAVLGLIGLAVSPALAAVAAVTTYDVTSHAYATLAPLSTLNAATTYVRGSPAAPEATHVAVGSDVVAAKCEVGATAVDSAPAVGEVD